MKIRKKNKLIAKLNDNLRKNIFDPNINGQIVLTSGVSSLPFAFAIIEQVKNFNNFNEHNDPYGEHDFGEVLINNIKFFWKIDYYENKEMQYGSEDPSDSEKTFRVLTIMKGDEY